MFLGTASGSPGDHGQTRAKKPFCSAPSLVGPGSSALPVTSAHRAGSEGWGWPQPCLGRWEPRAPRTCRVLWNLERSCEVGSPGFYLSAWGPSLVPLSLQEPLEEPGHDTGSVSVCRDSACAGVFAAPCAPSLGPGAVREEGRGRARYGVWEQTGNGQSCAAKPGKWRARAIPARLLREDPGRSPQGPFRRREPERLRSADPRPLTETARAPSAAPATGSPSSSAAGLQSYCSACFYTWPDATGENNFILGGGSQLLPALLAQEQGSSP